MNVTTLRHDGHDDTKLTMDPQKGVLRAHRVIVFIVTPAVARSGWFGVMR
jgi:hypothetical protein